MGKGLEGPQVPRHHCSACCLLLAARCSLLAICCSPSTSAASAAASATSFACSPACSASNPKAFKLTLCATLWCGAEEIIAQARAGLAAMDAEEAEPDYYLQPDC